MKTNVCDNFKCKPDAICISRNEDEKEKPICVCLNGQPTPDNCDKIGEILFDKGIRLNGIFGHRRNGQMG